MNRPTNEDEYLKDFGKHLVTLRTGKMTQEKLASKANLSTETISALERGVWSTRISHLHAISAALGLEIEDLFKGLRHRGRR